MTNDGIVSAMKKFLDVDKISIVQAGDFAKAMETAAKEEEIQEEAAVR